MARTWNALELRMTSELWTTYRASLSRLLPKLSSGQLVTLLQYKSFLSLPKGPYYQAERAHPTNLLIREIVQAVLGGQVSFQRYTVTCSA